MKKQTKKREFLVNEVQNGVILYSTRIFAASYKSLWYTSMMSRILLNKSFESFLDIKDVTDGKRCN